MPTVTCGECGYRTELCDHADLLGVKRASHENKRGDWAYGSIRVGWALWNYVMLLLVGAPVWAAGAASLVIFILTLILDALRQRSMTTMATGKRREV